MKTIHNEFNNWEEFIIYLLTHNHQFELKESNIKGHTLIEEYKQLQFNEETSIQVGYLDNDKLIYITILNPNAPGLNKHNSSICFDENLFDENAKSEGDPGLPFTENNALGILEMLSKSLEGKEVLFYEEDVLSHSRVYINDDSGNKMYDFTYRWKKIPLINKILSIFSKPKNQYTEKETDLHDIFCGINLEKF